VLHTYTFSKESNLSITGSIASSATRRYLIYSEAHFQVFRPTGATRCTDGVKFGMEIGPLLHAKFHAYRCNGKGIGHPKMKFLLRFDQNVENRHLAGVYPLCNFHKIFQRLYLVSGCVSC